MTHNKWYCLHVKTGQELEIAKILNKRGFSTAVPLENRVIRKNGEWRQQTYIVFDGYVFVYMDYSWNKYYALAGISGIIKILGGGKAPSPLSKSETEFILTLSDMLANPSVIEFASNEEYKIVSGFLADYKDKIIKVQRRYKKASVKITVAGEEKEITVSFTEPTQTPEQTED